MIINNSFFGYFYNRLDFPIRFLYAHLPFLNRLFFWKLYSSDFKALDSQFEEMKAILGNRGFSFANKICLELGPGNSYINAYNMLMNGAKKVILVDKFSRQIKSPRQKEFFQEELKFIKKKYKKEKLFFLKNGTNDPKYIEFIEGDINNLDFEKKVDFILSKSVLEHVKDVEPTIAKLSQITAKGGWGYHSIDLRDHYNFASPFLFYKYSPKTWENLLTKEGKTYTNRRRYDEYLEIFKKNNFAIIAERVEKFPLPKNQKISPQFKKHQAFLNIGIIKILLKRK